MSTFKFVSLTSELNNDIMLHVVVKTNDPISYDKTVTVRFLFDKFYELKTELFSTKRNYSMIDNDSNVIKRKMTYIIIF